MAHPDIIETYTYYIKEIARRTPNLAYVHAVESRIAGNTTIDAPEGETLDFIFDEWTPRPFFAAGGFTAESAAEEAAARRNTAIVFGRYFISNPDLVERIRQGVPLADYNRDTFYLLGPEQRKGYTDYPKAT